MTQTPAVAEQSHQKGRKLESVRIPMRDGVHLVSDVYLPETEGCYPAIFMATPYNRKVGGTYPAGIRYWTDHGYVVIVADTRGSYDSDGETGFMIPDGNDNYDAIEWIAVQPWADGMVGMMGASYAGTNQWMAAKNCPPSLKCIVPSDSVGRFMEELPRNGGAFKTRWAIEWLQLVKTDGKLGSTVEPKVLLPHRPLRTVDELVTGEPIKLFREIVDHDTLDHYWQQIQFTDADFQRIDIPSLAFTGWFNGTLPGTAFYYQGMQSHSAARNDQFLVIGPWEHATASDGGHSHSGAPVTTVGDLAFPDHAFLPANEMTRAFYDWCLKKGPRPEYPSARVYITGSDQWLSLPSYPHPKTVMREMYLHSDGQASLAAHTGGLDWTKPGDEPPDHFVYDPGDPVPESVIRDGKAFRLQSMPVDLRQVQDRADVLVYETEPLAEPLTILGNVRLMLEASTSALDTDFTSHIADVHPDGRAIKLGPQSGAIIRARYRQGFDRARLMTPGKPESFALDYFDIGHTFMAGHRLRISITSSNFPWISANPNTGNPIGSDTAPPQRAHQTIYHDSQRPSRLLLPVIATPEAGQ